VNVTGLGTMVPEVKVQVIVYSIGSAWAGTAKIIKPARMI